MSLEPRFSAFYHWTENFKGLTIKQLKQVHQLLEGINYKAGELIPSQIEVTGDQTEAGEVLGKTGSELYSLQQYDKKFVQPIFWHLSPATYPQVFDLIWVYITEELIRWRDKKYVRFKLSFDYEINQLLQQLTNQPNASLERRQQWLHQLHNLQEVYKQEPMLKSKK